MNGEINEEKDYEELSRLGLKLGIPVQHVMLKIELSDSLSGKTEMVYDGRSRTWLRNYYNYLISQIGGAITGTTYGAGYLGIKQVAGTVATLNFTNNSAGLYMVGTANNSDNGILVGRGTTAESFEHNALATPITHGTGANQLSHAAQYAAVLSYVAGTKTWTSVMVRNFTNNSGSTIVVTESGLVYTSLSGTYYLLNRDLTAWGAGVSVTAGKVLTVTYTLSLTFPA